MPSFTLAQPRSSFAAAVPSTFIHAALIACALWVTRATASALIADPRVIAIDWPLPTVSHTASTIATPTIPGAPIISAPVIPDLPIPDPPPVLPGVPRVDPGTDVPGTPSTAPGHPGTDTVSLAQIFREAEVDELPQLLSAGRLRYPAVLAEAGIVGAVTLTFVIDAEGRVDPAAIEILSATHAGFIAAAQEAVATSRFRPARKHGTAVRVRVRQTIAFKH